MDKTAKTESGKNVAEIETQKATGDNKEKIQEKPSKVLDLIGAMYQMKYGRHGQRRKKKWAVGCSIPGSLQEEL